jgi:hypothetical protein
VDRGANLTWKAPTNRGGGTLTYRVTWSSGKGHVHSVRRKDPSASVHGLTGGRTYTFTVTAANAAGASPGVTVTVTPQAPAPAGGG